VLGVVCTFLLGLTDRCLGIMGWFQTAMALTAGTRLGHYDVTSLLGEGGMGEVYQARDTKLDRDVALKVLPEAFTSDPDRLARFESEAKVLASLNHPIVCRRL